MAKSGTHTVIESRGQRVLCEFNCYCQKPYIYVWLNTGVTGNYVIKCPTCGHEHYRAIEKGVITKDRHSVALANCEVIHPMPSAAQKEQRKRGLIAKVREMEAVGAHK
jgi:hypothetical protein